jgi:hypothetical protein
MAEMRGPSEGVRGVDVEAPNGSKRKLNADKTGKINVEDKNLVTKLKAEGFTLATTSVGGFGGVGYPCSKCSFNSVFRVFTCPKCGEGNDLRS